MTDYNNLLVAPPRRARSRRALDWILLAVAVLAVLLCWHFAAASLGPGPAKPASVQFTPEQVQTARATGRLLSMRGLTP